MHSEEHKAIAFLQLVLGVRTMLCIVCDTLLALLRGARLVTGLGNMVRKLPLPELAAAVLEPGVVVSPLLANLAVRGGRVHRLLRTWACHFGSISARIVLGIPCDREIIAHSIRFFNYRVIYI